MRQTLARAVSWELIATNPAKVGVDNPVPVRREQRPLESWEDLRLLARALGPRYGPMILFAAATGLRPGEWTALEHRDIDLIAGVVLVKRLSQRTAQDHQDARQHPRRPAATHPWPRRSSTMTGARRLRRSATAVKVAGSNPTPWTSTMAAASGPVGDGSLMRRRTASS